jgi:fumarate reductase subunit C
LNVRLFFWQRGTAMLLVPMIIVHLAVIFYAMGYHLTASAILARTQGSIAWGLFYGLFVLLAATHASIGIRNVLREWTRLRDRAAGTTALLFGATLVLLGLRAVAAVVLP